MKKIMILLVMVTGATLSQGSYAQVSVNVNIGNQPIWGPTGYNYVDYYYLPDLDIYYYVPQQQWIYLSGNQWISAPTLPPQYRDYDLYRLHKVIINEPKPYLHNQTYRQRYTQFKGRYDQQAIRDSRDSKYFVIANHPQHGNSAGVPRNQPVNTQTAPQGPGRNGQSSKRTGAKRTQPDWGKAEPD